MAALPDFRLGPDLPTAAPRLSIATSRGGDIGALVKAALGGLDSQLGLRRFIAPGDVVLLKPNVAFDRPPHLGATAHPEIVRWVIRLCRAAGAREVLVTDHPVESAAACFARSGIERVAREEGARVVLPSEGDFVPVALPAGPAAAGPRQWPMLVEPLRRATRLIGIAPVKDHNLAGASMVLKNWYGLLGGPRGQFHQVIHEAISDLAVLVRPTLVIADGTRAMLRNGPTGGSTDDVRPGGVLGRAVVVAAVDSIACDAWCNEVVLGRAPGTLRYLDLAEQKSRAAVEAGEGKAGALPGQRSDWRAYERAGQVVQADV